MNDQATFAITCGSTNMFSSYQSSYEKDDRRRNKRVPRSIGITVDPIDAEEQPQGEAFFAITRDLSRKGLSFVSPVEAPFEYACITLQDQPGREVICRVCYSNLIVKSEREDVYLTGVEFLYERFSR